MEAMEAPSSIPLAKSGSKNEEEDTVLTPTSSTASMTPDNMYYHPVGQSLNPESAQEHDDLLQNGDVRQDSFPAPQQPLLQPAQASTGLRRTGSGSVFPNDSEHLSTSSHEVESKDYLPPFEGQGLRRTSTPSTFIPPTKAPSFVPMYNITQLLGWLSKRVTKHSDSPSTWVGFWALGGVTCASYVLTPMRDAVALAVGVQHMPKLTLASTLLAVVSSVPIGWLFEAPDPKRRKLWKRMGLTRGETQGTSLALFYRMFALSLMSYAIGFKGVETFVSSNKGDDTEWSLLTSLGHVMYIAFFLVVHLMKLHSLSLMWGVTTEAMEYEEVARRRMGKAGGTKTRLQRLAFVGFGGTLGGILGSFIASSMARVLQMSGLLVVAALLLEMSSELSIELGRMMQTHWEEQQLFKSSDNLAALDTSMKRSTSLGSMKRVASGNSLFKASKHKSFSDLNKASKQPQEPTIEEQMNDNSFAQRLMRGITTILRSRLLMAIFTYNALYASTSVLLSFQRAALVVSRNTSSTTVSDTAFLANINMASSVAVFALQLSGVGAYVAHACGSRGTLALMPIIRLLGVLGLAWWHQVSNGRPPNLIIFLLLDECCRVMNLAVAKPVRESLWRGLSNEARYEAKPIVDTLANRWGAGSAAVLVSLVDKSLNIFGVGVVDSEGSRTVFGFPPVLFLCMCCAAWWTMVSADLGHIRHRIDMELKKQQ